MLEITGPDVRGSQGHSGPAPHLETGSRGHRSPHWPSSAPLIFEPWDFQPASSAGLSVDPLLGGSSRRRASV